MATQPITGSAIAAFPTTAPMPAVTRILARFERDQLAGFIAVALDLIDTLDGDTDDEDNADREASNGGDQDRAYVEWQTMRGAAKRGHNLRGRPCGVRPSAATTCWLARKTMNLAATKPMGFSPRTRTRRATVSLPAAQAAPSPIPAGASMMGKSLTAPWTLASHRRSL